MIVHFDCDSCDTWLTRPHSARPSGALSTCRLPKPTRCSPAHAEQSLRKRGTIDAFRYLMDCAAQCATQRPGVWQYSHFSKSGFGWMTAKTKAKSKAAPAPAPGIIGTQTAAALLMVTPEWIRRLTVQGWIAKVAKDQYRVQDVVQGYIRFLKDAERRSSKSASHSRVQDARAREIELRVAREESRIVDIEDVNAAVGDIVGAFRSELAGLPASCTRDLEQRRVIEKNLNGAIDRCRDRFEEARRNGWNGGEGAVEVEETNAG